MSSNHGKSVSKNGNGTDDDQQYPEVSNNHPAEIGNSSDKEIPLSDRQVKFCELSKLVVPPISGENTASFDDAVIATMMLPLERQYNVSSASIPGAFAVNGSGCINPAVYDNLNHSDSNDTEYDSNVEPSIPFYAVNAELVEPSSTIIPGHSNEIEGHNRADTVTVDMVTVDAKLNQRFEEKRSNDKSSSKFFRRKFLVAYMIILILCIGITFGVTRTIEENEERTEHQVENQEPQNFMNNSEFLGNITLLESEVHHSADSQEVDSEDRVEPNTFKSGGN